MADEPDPTPRSDPWLRVDPGGPGPGPGGWVSKMIFDNDAVAWHVGDKAFDTLVLNNLPTTEQGTNAIGTITATIFLHHYGAHLTDPRLSGPGVTYQTVTIAPDSQKFFRVNLDTSHAGTVSGQSIYVQNLDGGGSTLVPITATVYNYAKPVFTQTAGPHGKLTHTPGTNDWTLDLGVRPAGGWLSEPELKIGFANAAKGPTDTLVLNPGGLRAGVIDHPPPKGPQDLVNVNGTTFDIHQAGMVLSTMAFIPNKLDNFIPSTQYLTIVDHTA